MSGTAGGSRTRDDDEGAVFEALADPTRRFVVEMLATTGSVTATEIAGRLPLTRQAAARHLAVLGEAGLVTAQRIGRETRYRLAPERLRTVTDWVGTVGTAWDDRLAALQRQLQAP